MRKIRVCIGSNDGETVAQSHMGDMAYFVIYDLGENAPPEFVEKRVNTARGMDHANSDKMQAVLGLVGDADVLVARRKSPNFSNIASKTKYQPVVVQAEQVTDVLTVLGRSFAQVYGYVERRGNGERFSTIPELE